jgi:hypothetical protein
MTSRRNFLTTGIAFLAAPAIVRVSSLMPISVQPTSWVNASAQQIMDDVSDMIVEIQAAMFRDKIAEAMHSRYPHHINCRCQLVGFV